MSFSCANNNIHLKNQNYDEIRAYQDEPNSIDNLG